MDKLRPILERALQKIDKEIDDLNLKYGARSGKYLQITKEFIGELYKRCLEFPDAKLEVDW
jgi:hypothetical protein